MTGFGTGQTNRNGLSITVELRSVNNRFLDLNFRLPHVLYQREQDLRELISKRLNRGRVLVQVTEEWCDDAMPAIRIDKGKARSYLNALKELKTELSLAGEISLDQILSFSDIVVSEIDDAYREKLWVLTQEAVNSALDNLVDSSEAEGRNLSKDIIERICLVEKTLSKIKEIKDSQVLIYQERLSTRLREVLTDDRIDPNRLETEIALIADRLDISEEIVRFESHIDLFNQSLKVDKAIGKTLGFILQEMGREANTIASKSWLTEISQSAIQIKEILEQVREQVQNLE